MRLKNWSISLVILSVLIVVAMGLPFSIHNMSEDGQMTGCIIMMDKDVICNMSAQEHLSAWQSMFAAIPPQILLLAALILLTIPIFRYLLYKPPRLLFFQPKEKFSHIFNHLQEAFSSGIIHSKAY